MSQMTDSTIQKVTIWWEYTLENERLEPKNGALEDNVPFQLGDFLVPGP